MRPLRLAGNRPNTSAKLSLPPEDFAEGLIRRLQYTRPEPGDIIGTHQFSRARPERSRA